MVERNPLHYALFVTYFPHLIAGPVLHHAEMMPQFRLAEIYRPQLRNFVDRPGLPAHGPREEGADRRQRRADRQHGVRRERGRPLAASAAWLGVIAYTLQIYFDFSGYSDMAVGLCLLFGVRLPYNFNSPYKAWNITEFWRRWHMTLSRFLRDYLYVPLGGNRHGRARRYVNLMLTMLLGGLWHGASWTFVIWGGLHGAYLVVNHGWQWLREKLGWQRASSGVGGVLGARRQRGADVAVRDGGLGVLPGAVDSASAQDILASMFGLRDGGLPIVVAGRLFAGCRGVDRRCSHCSPCSAATRRN